MLSGVSVGQGPDQGSRVSCFHKIKMPCSIGEEVLDSRHQQASLSPHLFRKAKAARDRASVADCFMLKPEQVRDSRGGNLCSFAASNGLCWPSVPR